MLAPCQELEAQPAACTILAKRLPIIGCEAVGGQDSGSSSTVLMPQGVRPPKGRISFTAGHEARVELAQVDAQTESSHVAGTADEQLKAQLEPVQRIVRAAQREHGAADALGARRDLLASREKGRRGRRVGEHEHTLRDLGIAGGRKPEHAIRAGVRVIELECMVESDGTRRVRGRHHAERPLVRVLQRFHRRRLAHAATDRLEGQRLAEGVKAHVHESAAERGSAERLEGAEQKGLILREEAAAARVLLAVERDLERRDRRMRGGDTAERLAHVIVRGAHCAVGQPEAATIVYPTGEGGRLDNHMRPSSERSTLGREAAHL